MEEQKRVVLFGVGVIALALSLRFAPTVALGQTELLQTPPETTLSATDPTELSTEPSPGLTILPEDGQAVELYDLVGYEPDVETLLAASLSWQLRSSEPTVLIIHTHGAESYTKQPWEDYTEDSIYRTFDADYNMISIGQELARVLEEGGVHVIHDRMMHDYPSFSGAYEHARSTIQSYLAAYPSICMVIDLHRDALDFEQDPQLSTYAKADGQVSSQLMLVAGTDANLEYPGWQENLSLGLKLMAVLEKEYPGITRPIHLRAERFNLDLTPGSLLVEVGANGDTHEMALVAARALGNGILALADGANLQQ